MHCPHAPSIHLSTSPSGFQPQVLNSTIYAPVIHTLSCGRVSGSCVPSLPSPGGDRDTEPMCVWVECISYRPWPPPHFSPYFHSRGFQTTTATDGYGAPAIGYGKETVQAALRCNPKIRMGMGMGAPVSTVTFLRYARGSLRGSALCAQLEDRECISFSNNMFELTLKRVICQVHLVLERFLPYATSRPSRPSARLNVGTLFLDGHRQMTCSDSFWSPPLYGDSRLGHLSERTPSNIVTTAGAVRRPTA